MTYHRLHVFSVGDGHGKFYGADGTAASDSQIVDVVLREGGGMRSWLVACHGSGRMAVRELQGQQQRKMGPEEVAQLHEVLGELAGVLNVW